MRASSFCLSIGKWSWGPGCHSFIAVLTACAVAVDSQTLQYKRAGENDRDTKREETDNHIACSHPDLVRATGSVLEEFSLGI